MNRGLSQERLVEMGPLAFIPLERQTDLAQVLHWQCASNGLLKGKAFICAAL